MAYHFQRISLVSFLANPFILPAQPAVMILGGLAVLLSHVWFPLGQIAAWVAWPFVVYTIRMVELFDRVPHGTIFLGEALHLVRDPVLRGAFLRDFWRGPIKRVASNLLSGIRSKSPWESD